MDIITYALSKKIAAHALSGVQSMSINGQTLIINTKDSGVLTITFPTPKDGVSVADIDVNADNQIVFTMSDGSEFISGKIPTVKGKDGVSPTITENADNTDKIYKLDITTVDSTFTTPNLKGADGQGGTGGSGEENIIDSISVNGVNVTPDENKNVDIEVPNIYVGDTEPMDDSIEVWINPNGESSPIEVPIEKIKVNGELQTPVNKVVDITVPDAYDDTDIRAELANKADITAIPSKVSDLENDSRYQTRSDIDTILMNYSAEINSYIGEQIANAEHLKREIVTVLPSDTEASDNIIYMLKVESATGNDKYKEYMKIDGTVQMVGDTSVDLTDYAKTVDIPTTVAELTDSADYAKTADVNDSISTLQTDKANASDLTAHTDDTDIHVTANDKTLWNTVEDKVDKTDIATVLDDTVTDEQVTSALLAKTELDKKVDKTSIVTELSEESTNDEIVGALTTYNKLQKLESANKEQFATANGNFIIVNDSVDGNIVDLKLYGKSEQKQYSGKNLLDCSGLTEQTINGVTFTPIYDNGLLQYININGTATDTVNYLIFDDDNFTNENRFISIMEQEISGIKGHLAITTKVSSTLNDTLNVIFPTSYEYKKWQQGPLLNLTLKLEVEPGTYNNVKVYPMITLDTVSDYEPYVGGIPSPNPAYPQEIKSVVNPSVKTCGGAYLNLITEEQWNWLKENESRWNYDKCSVLIYRSDGNLTLRYPKTSFSTGYCRIVITKKGNIMLNETEISKDVYKSGDDVSDTGYLLLHANHDGLYRDSNETIGLPNDNCSATFPYTLNAIPVSEGGNVTIDGQQYVSDYVDVERGKLVKMVDSSKLDNTQSIVDKTEWLLAEPQEIDLMQKEIQAFKALATYYPTTNISVNSDQLDGYAELKYPTTDVSGLASRNESRIAELAKDTDDKFDDVNESLGTLEFGEVAGGKNLANINDFKALTTNPSRYGYEWLSMKGGTYTFNITNGKNILYIGYKHNGEFVNPNSVVNNSKVQTITISDGDDIVIWYENGVTENTVTKLQLEVGSVATEYEPYIPSVKMLAEENAQQNTEAMDLKMLGWNVPKECPVQNYVDGNGVFHQRVCRVDLGTLDWSYSSEYKRFSTIGITDYKKKDSGSNTWVADAFLKDYSTTSGNNTASDSYNKSIGFNGTSNMFFVKNTSYTDATTFKNAMQGKYLYYELETPITMTIDGNEAVEGLSSNLSQLEFGEIAAGKNLFNGNFIEEVLEAGKNYTDVKLIKEQKSIKDIKGITFAVFGAYLKKGTYTFSYTNDAYFSLNRVAIAGTDCVLAIESIRKSYTWTQNVDGWTYFGIEGDDSETGVTDTPFSITPDIQIEKGAQATAYETYIPSIKMLEDEVSVQNDSLSVIGKCKNLLKPTLQTTTKNGVTCTNNGDGTYTINGTATQDTDFTFFDNLEKYQHLKNRTVKLVGCPKGGSDTTYRLMLQLQKVPWPSAIDIGKGSSVTVDNNDNWACWIRIYKDATVSNLTFKPMLVFDDKTPNATYDDFVPYTGDGDTLTHDVAEIKNDLKDLGGMVTKQGHFGSNKTDFTLENLYEGFQQFMITTLYRSTGEPNDCDGYIIIHKESSSGIKSFKVYGASGVTVSYDSSSNKITLTTTKPYMSLYVTSNKNFDIV